MKCECGFKFSGPGEYRNCNAFLTEKGNSGVICPECGLSYVFINGVAHKFLEKGGKDEDTQDG